jgi:acetyl esterase/lipase
VVILTVQHIISRQLPVSHGVVAISPWTDLSSSGQSYAHNRLVDAMICPEALSWSIKHVLGHHREQRS